MKRAISHILILAIATLLMGCGSTHRVTQLIEHTSVDTIYLTSQQYDSIYIYQERYQDRSRDTIYLKDVSVEYRYKLLRDTVKIIQTDSIPYEVTAVETKEITRPLTCFDYICRYSFFFLLGILLYFIYRKLKAFKKVVV